MIYRSKAPLRIGLAGGGTDVSPYSDLFGGAILNTTISLSAYASIEPLDEKQIILHAFDRNEEQRFELSGQLPIDGKKTTVALSIKFASGANPTSFKGTLKFGGKTVMNLQGTKL